MSPEEISDLILEHIEYGERLAKSFLAKWNCRLSTGQLLSVVGVALTEASARFDPDRGVNFKTFLFYYLKGILLKEVKDEANPERVLKLVSDTNFDPTPDMLPEGLTPWPQSSVEKVTPEKLVEKKELFRECAKASEDLDDFEQEVLVRNFFEDQTVTQIANDLGYSRSHIFKSKNYSTSQIGKKITPEKICFRR